MLTCIEDYFDHYGGPCNFVYKLILYDGTLSVYNITPKETQNENEVLLTHDLIYTCECTRNEFDDTKSKPLLNVRFAIEDHTKSIFVASEFYDDDLSMENFDEVCVIFDFFGKYFHVNCDPYLIRYVKVDVYQDW